MKPVAIIGAGITGLTAAFYLKWAGIPVMIYESGNRVGGAIQSIRDGGYLAECGPNTILETSPRITRLIRDAGLESRRMNPDPKSETRYLVRYGRVIPMPESPLAFMASDLFTWRAKLALMKEPFIKARRDGKEESLAEFVTRRLGKEFLDQAIDAMVGGVYAGDPGRLSLKQAFPKLAALEEKYGSIIKGSLLGARERRNRGDVAKDRAPKFSFDEGLQVLPDTLAIQLEGCIRLQASRIEINRDAEGWNLSFTAKGEPHRAVHSAVIYAGNAHQLPGLKVSHGMENLDFSAFSEIRHPPIASVVLGFRREDVAHGCAGFGALIPKVEGFKILGTIFSSSLFPNRAPAGHLVLTSYIGGERYPELALLPEKELLESVRRDLEKLLGVKGHPTFHHYARYTKAIPQYNLGYAGYRELFDSMEARTPGFYFAGQYRDGISLSDSILSGCRIAERVEKSFPSLQPVS
jgi:oxygen-dependent protoporphyrinogen oxidase